LKIKRPQERKEVKMAKPKVAFYWCASCGGCEETVVDLNEDLLKVAEAVDIVLWPVALDFKRKDVEALGDGEIAVSFINGAVRTEEQEEMVKLLRSKSGLVVAFGSCAHMGGIPGLGNFWTRDTIFQRIYREVPTVENPDEATPQQKTVFDFGELTSPEVRNIPTEIPKEGIGVVEAPRGTLFHHYKTDERGILTEVNLIVATGNNAAPIWMSIEKAAKSLIHKGEVSDGILNMIEMAFRAYDPCHACATHSLPGRMPLEVNVYNSRGDLVKQLKRGE